MGTFTANSTTSLSGMLAGWAKQIISTAQDSKQVDDSIYTPLKNALTNAITAIQAVSAAKAKISLVLTEPTGPRVLKLQIANTLLRSASDAATASLAAVQSAADTTFKKLGASFLPQKPANADPATVASVKADVCRYLDAAGSPTQALTASGDLLAESLARKDDTGALRAWLLTGGELELYYRASGIDPMKAEAVFQPVIAAASPTGEAPDAVDLRALIGNGKGTLRGFLSVAPGVISQDTRAVQDWINASQFNVQDTPTVPYRGPLAE